MVSRPLQFITWICAGLLSPVLLCGIGLWANGLLSTDEVQTSATSPSNIAQTKHQFLSEGNSGQKNNLPHDLASLPPTTDDYTRSVALRALLSSTDQATVKSLLEQAKAIRPENQRLTTQIEIFRRFAVFDPAEAMKHTFDIPWNRRAPIVKAIFLEWATSDIDTAIAHAKSLGHTDQRTALDAILRIRDDWSDDRLQQLVREFGLESIGAEVLEQIQVIRAFDDPQSSWNSLLEDDQIDSLQIDSLATILELWVARDGFSVVSAALESIPRIDSPLGLLTPVLKPIARDNPQRAFELINEFSENARNTAAWIVLDEWAETDPVAAMNAVSEFDIHPSHTKDSLMRKIGKVWANNAPHEAIKELPKYFSRNQLRTLRGNALQQIVRESPSEAVDILNELSNGVQDLGGALVEAWAEADARSALNWITSQEEALQPKLLRYAIPALVEIDPDLALNTVLNQTITDGQIGLEYEVIRILAEYDVQRAKEMLAQVRDHDHTVKRAYSELGRALVRQNKSSSAIEMSTELPESLQDDYFREIINQIFNTDQAELYEILSLLPKRKYQQAAAEYLMWDSGFGGYSHWYFTDEQIEEIRGFQ